MSSPDPLKQRYTCPDSGDDLARRRFPVIPALIGLLAAANVASAVLTLIE